jgi:hypothetical protein
VLVHEASFEFDAAYKQLARRQRFTLATHDERLANIAGHRGIGVARLDRLAPLARPTDTEAYTVTREPKLPECGAFLDRTYRRAAPLILFAASAWTRRVG